MFSDKIFTDWLKKLFSKFKINSSLYNKRTNFDGKIYLQYQIEIFGNDNLNKIIKNINFKNENHITKLKLWQRYGYCNSHVSLNDRYNLLNNKL